ncbi:hypothetical protein Ga0074812_106273 [Parafrankia irregularis]|uniref:Uncharacterized protein n=1 Tax=Parafrankia irregularis TaxID=795642 RepID=A0A0S4QLT0_9ACTN|nr:MULTISPECIES: hypothetical protein [Parafrankia]MBE3202228.1 hypothetical protein [Parafrankia sp. CH37]MBE3202240.1 hypothetical protein [Parafrankia sp. CH37]MBE3202252.1 hypothetical protein [Parafrankia sp. CH37]CUU56018.1 hypothetical protein Ga0074812_106273 [Parafrankia irregularis]
MPDDAVADSVDSPDSDSPYSVLPAAGPYGVAIGSALITMVEPHPGAEAEYNRWYEDDHFYAGAMAMPWMFAGRRWVAPRALQALREPADSAVARPLEAGKYIAVYWLTRGRHRDHMRWTVATNQRLNADGRIFHRRDHVFTAFQDYLGAVYRDGRGGALDIHALDHPYGGLVVEVVDAVGEALVDEAAAGTAGATGVGDAAGVAGVGGVGGAAISALVDWLRAERAPRVLAPGGAVAMGLLFTPLPLPEDRMAYVDQVAGLGRRLTVLWFTETTPARCWAPGFTAAAADWEKSGLGRLELLAPFVPTLPGTQTYVDELR